MNYLEALYNQYFANNPEIVTFLTFGDLMGFLLFAFIGFLFGFFVGRVTGSR